VLLSGKRKIITNLMKRTIYIIGVTSIFLMLIITGCSREVKLVTGSYSVTGDSGINVFDFNLSDGSMTSLSSFNAGPNPSFFCFRRNSNLIYAINEVDTFMNVRAGGLTTISHDGAFGNLRKVNEMAVPNGGPCNISLNPQNDFILIANYDGGSVAVVSVDGSGIPVAVTDTVHFRAGEGNISHAHKIAFDPTGQKVYVTDLGLDRIWIFTLDRSSGKLISSFADGITLPKRTGPRHFVFNEAGTRLYVIGELNSTITVLNVDKDKGLIPVQTITTLKNGSTGENACADIHIDRSGKHLYGSNRGENTIVTYNIDTDGSLKPAGHSDCGGNWPRNFTIDPSGKYLLVANQKSENIAVFKIDPKTGIPSQKIQDIKVKAPVCLKFK
jgi:6-phosphogluconolactonase